MRAKRLRAASIIIVAIGALTFPVWGPMNGASSAPKADPTCIPTPTPTCVPDLPSGLPTEGLPSGAPSDLPSAAPTDSLPPVPAPPAPTAIPSASPGGLALPASGCVGYLRGFTSSCGFHLSGTRIIAAGFVTSGGVVVPPVTPPSGLPTPSGLPSGAPSVPPTGSIVPSPLPTPTGLPTPGAPVAHKGRGGTRIQIEIVTSSGQVLLRCTGDGDGFATCLQTTSVKVASGEVVECRAKRPGLGLFGCGSF